MRVQAVCLIVNRASGTRRTDAEIDALERAFDENFRAPSKRVFRVTENHQEVEQVACDFVATHVQPVLLIAAGGGGTLRAMVHGVMVQVARGVVALDEVRVSGLRLGSGNLVPKLFGVPSDPSLALANIAQGLDRGLAQPCCLYRCDFEAANGTKSEYGVALGLFGPLGRVPDDVHRAKTRHRGLYQLAARVFGIETVTSLQYLTLGLARTAKCLINPRNADLIHVNYAGVCEPRRILAGMLMNFPIPVLPLRAGVEIGEPRLVLGLIPLWGRWRTLRNLLGWRELERHAVKYQITPDEPITIEFEESDHNIVALDEDTFIASARIRFVVAGTLAFVGGKV